jgi:hypothetical protein
MNKKAAEAAKEVYVALGSAWDVKDAYAATLAASPFAPERLEP